MLSDSTLNLIKKAQQQATVTISKNSITNLDVVKYFFEDKILIGRTNSIRLTELLSQEDVEVNIQSEIEGLAWLEVLTAKKNEMGDKLIVAHGTTVFTVDKDNTKWRESFRGREVEVTNVYFFREENRPYYEALFEIDKEIANATNQEEKDLLILASSKLKGWLVVDKNN